MSLSNGLVNKEGPRPTKVVLKLIFERQEIVLLGAGAGGGFVRHGRVSIEAGGGTAEHGLPGRRLG
ncbi:hypothetical protein E2C01_054251 [Portunus trituberculatus]|uniref:Uncharacterized protein n=1 Tax=Portunus trituberculatus TaxID=210409 RepID=A0A5B7GMS3_PORTR|nr:hypothetical protein [Portunus trituberculatus]